MKRSLLVLFVLLAASAFAGSREVETKEIETLISAVAKLDGAKFVRNGKAYDPATAAKFLIDKIATRSSTTGRVYLVRFADGREVPVAEFLQRIMVAHDRPR